MTKIEKATRYMESIARDNRHGYDQLHRMGPIDFDCSGLNIKGWVKAGVPVNKAVKKTVTVNGKQKTVTIPGATYTGNIRNAYIAHGFKYVTRSVDLKTGRGLKRGDVLLREGHHVAQYCGNGWEVEASINEKGKILGGKPGDQTGREILIRRYRNYPWDFVLRYQEKADTVSKTDNELDKIAKEVIAGKWGSGDTRRIKLSSAGYSYKKVQARVNQLIKKATAKKAHTNARHGKKDINAIAKEVIAGKWGSGDARRIKLTSAGYNYKKVQARVNKLLKG